MKSIFSVVRHEILAPLSRQDLTTVLYYKGGAFASADEYARFVYVATSWFASNYTKGVALRGVAAGLRENPKTFQPVFNSFADRLIDTAASWLAHKDADLSTAATFFFEQAPPHMREADRAHAEDAKRKAELAAAQPPNGWLGWFSRKPTPHTPT